MTGLTSTFVPKKAPVLYTLFDSEVRPKRAKLRDEYVLELVLLYDQTTATVPQLARAFDLDEDETETFFRTTHAPSVARSWVRGLNLTHRDPAIRRIVTSSAVRLQEAIENGVNYVEHTVTVLTNLKTAMATGKPETIPTLKTMNEVRAAHEFFFKAAKDVLDLLSRAEWPAPEVEEDDIEDLTEDDECEVVELTEDGADSDGKDEILDGDVEDVPGESDLDDSDDETEVVEIPTLNRTPPSVTQAWFFTAH